MKWQLAVGQKMGRFKGEHFDVRSLNIIVQEGSERFDGGLSYLKSMAAPYAHLGIEFIPLGGINPSNLSEYLGSSLVAAIGGSWIASRELINAQDWTGITNNALEAREIAG